MENAENRVLEPWERQANESVKAFEAFTAYRDMGTDRSLAKVGTKLGKSTALMERWSVTHRWVARVEVWENEKDRIVREELAKGVTAMRKKHAGIAAIMLDKAVKGLQAIPLEELTMQDIARAVDVATKLERLSRGEATEKTESKTELAGALTVSNIDLGKLTDDELGQLDELLNKSQPG
jgi:hypothetical protein